MSGGDRLIGCTVGGCYPETPCPECSGEAAQERLAVVALLCEPVGRTGRGARSVADLVADLRARVAANDHGIGPGKVLRLFEEAADMIEALQEGVSAMAAVCDRRIEELEWQVERARDDELEDQYRRAKGW